MMRRYLGKRRTKSWKLDDESHGELACKDTEVGVGEHGDESNCTYMLERGSVWPY
jgi:hypothetical protein